ncbi:SRPBCC family protein [Aequorivita sp. H23M31]|uniref:SRPBCC family protein n=1 Tax=Aequorivita ciconiae TaxID=2494375 RepID=A0A451FSC8_9FLAO|nr:SRPBCC family protein [Aequorivita sp. H23M31]QAA80303.1 SRPBCC family protein [Aequorivita sp. H23M31]
MKLNSNKVTVQKSAEELCDYLTDVKNFKAIMPENITKFELLNDKAFLFALKGMPDIALEIKDVQKPKKVVLGAKSDKFPFTLTADIDEVTENTSTVELLFDGEFNAMMAMMIKGPLSKFIETLATNLEKI